MIGVARIAAIQGAKRTADLIPLCHPLALTRVAVEFDIDETLPGVHCTAQVETFGRSGVRDGSADRRADASADRV